MTITAVTGQKAGAIANSTTSVTRAYPNDVTAGNLALIGPWKFSLASALFVDGDVTKSAGAAVMAAPKVGKQNGFLYNAVNELDAASYYSAITGSGPATMQLTAAVGSFIAISIDEYHSDRGAIIPEPGVDNTATGNSAAPNSGSVTSIGSYQSVFHAVMTTNNGGGNNTITPTGTFTEIFEDENGVTDQPGSAISRIVNSGVTDAGSWTATSDNWVAVIKSYREPDPAPVGVGIFYTKA
jgi:hypothetical protein